MSSSLTHEQAQQLLPWLVNGTLPAPERELVDRHVRGCLACHVELKEQRRLRALLRERPTVAISPEQGFSELIKRIDAEEPRGSGGAPPRRFFSSPLRSVGWLAAATVAAAAIGVAAWLALSRPGSDTSPAYATLTSASRTRLLRLDIVFAPSATEEDMRTLVRDIGGTIVAGPSGIGRYTIQLDRDLSPSAVQALIDKLANDSRVRFVGPNLMQDEQR
jgi:anti-sigma factor RsiW